MRKFILIFSFFFFFPSLTHAASAGSYSIAGFDDASKVQLYVENLKTLVSQDKKEDIAQLIRFPLKISVAARRITLRSKDDFLKHYDQAFNSKVRDALAKQDSANLFANWQGAMIGNGEIWIRPGESGGIQIVAINN